jgi:hypothetical protein
VNAFPITLVVEFNRHQSLNMQRNASMIHHSSIRGPSATAALFVAHSATSFAYFICRVNNNRGTPWKLPNITSARFLLTQPPFLKLNAIHGERTTVYSDNPETLTSPHSTAHHGTHKGSSQIHSIEGL